MLSISGRILRRGQRKERRRRGDRREAAERTDRQRRAHVPEGVHALREPRGRARRRDGGRGGIGAPLSAAITRRTSAAGSDARASAAIIAMASAPAARTAGAVSAEIPPIATMGHRTAARTVATRPRPRAGNAFSLLAVAWIGPTPM